MKTNQGKKILFGTFCLLLIPSICLNFVLYKQLKNYYGLLYAVELDPLGLDSFPASVGATMDGKLLVVFFGDLRAAQWPNPELTNFAFINRGIGNQTSAQVASRFDAHIKSLQPDIIVLQVGINDLKTIPLFPERKEEIISNCEANIGQIVNDSLALDSKVVLTTIFPTGRVPLARRLVWSDDIDKAVVEVNDYIRNQSGEKVIIFDAASILSDANGKMKQEFGRDELHLNEQGYQALNLELDANP